MERKEDDNKINYATDEGVIDNGSEKKQDLRECLELLHAQSKIVERGLPSRIRRRNTKRVDFSTQEFFHRMAQ